MTRWWLVAVLVLALLVLVRAAVTRLQLSRAKHASLAGHPRWARRLSGWLPAYEYSEQLFFTADGAPEEIMAQRQQGFADLARHFAQRCPASIEATRLLAAGVADLDFTSRYRVPFPFSRRVREKLASGSVLAASRGRMLTDLDGNHYFDLTGSYGVNLLGNDFYKDCIDRGVALVRDLGPVLGSLHPVVAGNVRRLRELSGMDMVSFHMSGTEAVMQAVRLARYHTGRRKLVRFCGAYHGWWGDVQPGVGNPQTETDTFTLQDMSPRALRVLQTRRDIACVLVNPLQALHPNSTAPADSSLLPGRKPAAFDRRAYSAWLQQLRQVCERRGIVFIMDEVMMGFRLGAGGAQAYFGVQADMVTYGKTLGGGLPVGVLCGRAALMRRYREDRPGDICFARGTFNAHPAVMGTMHEFLTALELSPVRTLIEDADELWSGRAAQLNARLAAAGLPVQVAALGSVWTVNYGAESAYHWMLQYYLRAEGLALSWIGTGRFIFSLDYTEAEYEQVADRIVAAATRMQVDGWWWSEPAAARVLRRRLRADLLHAWWRACIGSISSPRRRWSGAR